jgi:hypothetical protein
MQDSIYELRAGGHKELELRPEGISIPTLKRLFINDYDSKNNLSQIIPIHLKEILPKYKFELKTIDVEKIKDIVFRKVYFEMIALEDRKKAQKFYNAHKDDDSEEEDAKVDVTKSMMSSPGKKHKGQINENFKKNT